jgi:hypothetical protein
MATKPKDTTFTLTPEAAAVLSQGLDHPIFQTYKPLRVFHAIGIFAVIKQLHADGRQVSKSLISAHCGVAYASIQPYIPILEELGLITEIPDPIPKRRTKILVPLTEGLPPTKAAKASRARVRKPSAKLKSGQD